MNTPLKSLAYQQGHIAAVVQVGVGQDDGIEISGGGGQGVPVTQPQLLIALKQTTVDQ